MLQDPEFKRMIEIIARVRPINQKPRLVKN
jgi:hypothetical protein